MRNQSNVMPILTALEIGVCPLIATTRRSIVRLLLRCGAAMLAILFFFGDPAPAQDSCSTCERVEVTIGFTVCITSHSSGYIKLGGTGPTWNLSSDCPSQPCPFWDASGVSYCGGPLILSSVGNPFSTSVTLNRPTTLSLGQGILSCQIDLSTPSGYTIYIDGNEASSLSFTGNGDAGRTYQVLVGKECNCTQGEGTSEAGASSGPSLEPPVFQASMGKLSDGRSAGNISIVRTGALEINDPRSVAYGAPPNTTDIETISDSNGIRQVKAPETLAHVVITNVNQYQILFYRIADVGAKINGLYTVSGQPFVTWRLKYLGTVNGNGQFEFAKIQNGLTTTSLLEKNWSGNKYVSLTKGGGASVQTKTLTESPQFNDIETIETKGPSGEVVSKIVKTFHPNRPDDLLQQVVDPDGAALTTTYAYHEGADPTHSAKLASVVNPDGSWEKYSYDSKGNLVLTLRPWKDGSFASATEVNSRATYFVYEYYNQGAGGGDTAFLTRRLLSVEEKIAGTLVSRTTYARSQTTINGEPATIEDQTLFSSAVDSQTTRTITYAPLASALYANRVAAIEFADDRKDSYSYEKGNYVTNADPALNQFTSEVNGLARRETVVHGTKTSPDGIALKTTKDVTVLDQRGNSVLAETYVYTGTDHERIGWTVNTYDDRGHLLQSTGHNGAVSTAVWDGDHKISSTDESGIQTDLSYDSLDRISAVVRRGIAAGGGFPAQPDIVTTYSYDAAGRTLSESRMSGSLALVSFSSYDKAGRVTSRTDTTGLVTTYAYAAGGRTETVTGPDGSTRINERYIDGILKSDMGTGTIARYLDHGVNPDGTQYTKEAMGPAGLASPRWTKTTTDWQGRTVKIEKPSFTGNDLVRTNGYNTKGQLRSEVITSGAGKVQADILHDYDELGDQTRMGLDVDAGGTLVPGSGDRIDETALVYEKSGSDWFRVTTTKRYLVNNDANPATLQVQKDRLTGFPVSGSLKTVSDTLVLDAMGNQTRATTAIDRVVKRVTGTVDTPESNVDAVKVSVNGLLQSAAPPVAQLATTYSYDALGRPIGVVDPQNGASTRTYNATTGQPISLNDGAQTITYEYYSAGHPNAGRLKAQTNGAGKTTYFKYSSRGETIQTWGDTTYPIETVFDDLGQQAERHTFRGGFGWQSSTWPTATTGQADATRWTYDVATGLLVQKEDAASKHVSYTFNASGRVKTRTWARLNGANPLVTTYSYDANTGEMTGISYSDSTPALVLGYDRGGRGSSVNDAAGVHAITYNVAGEMQSDQITSGILGGVQVTVGFDAFLRRNSLQASVSGTPVMSQAYTYDATSRLNVITSGAQSATYGYHPSGLLATTSFIGGTTISRTYDTLGRVQSVTTTPAAASAVSYTYIYNNLSQRTKITREDGSYWSIAYNDRGEVVAGKKYWSDATHAAGQHFEYAFDNLGNRSASKAGGDSQGLNLRQSSYTSNSLNQYIQRTVPGAIDILGSADSAAIVTVNNQSTYRRGDYFRKELTVDNNAGPVYTQVSVVGVKNNAGPGGEDVVSQQNGSAYLPQSTEVRTYDADGNLILDGQWNYTWDAENQLITMESIASAPAAAKKKLGFAYDYLGRRVQKQVYTWDGGTSSYQLQSTRKFIYDGWNVMGETDGANALIRSCVWGQDVNGSLQSAAGIGGLLVINEAGGSHIAGYDGNGNVSTLVRASTGAISATYEYDPFGDVLRSTGEYASTNPFRFSTKFADSEANLSYYGYRFYDPRTGRWISRDRVAEAGGNNLYGYVANAPVDFIDPRGLQREKAFYKVRELDPNSPNWDLAIGQMDHTYHSIELCVPDANLSKTLDSIYEDLRQFRHFEPNIARFEPTGHGRGHYELHDPGVQLLNGLAGNSIDIAIYERPSRREVFGVTLGHHPLVGVRRWHTDQAIAWGRSANGSARVRIETEAYEQTSSLTNIVGRWMTGREQQKAMWKAYLTNIAQFWIDKHHATIVGGTINGIVEDAGVTVNPYKSLLPEHLRQPTRFVTKIYP